MKNDVSSSYIYNILNFFHRCKKRFIKDKKFFESIGAISTIHFENCQETIKSV